MWILPKQLHTSHFVPDTAALISDLAEQSQICEQSLLARSKPSLARTWSQRWKRDSWTQHLSGRILKPSHGQSFVTAWTSSLEVTPANPFQQPASDSDETTLDTSGLGSQMELFPCDQESASSRTSKDTSALDSERSSANWKALVTRLRGEYSLRVKSAHLTNASECLSWPTATTRDHKGPSARAYKGHPENLSDITMMCWPTPTTAEAGKISCCPNYGQLGLSNHPDVHGYQVNRPKLGKSRSGQAAPANPSTDGSRQGLSQEGRLWMTPKSNQCGMTATTSGRPLEKATQLTTQVYVVNRQELWLTPRAKEPDSDPNFAARNGDRGEHCHGSLSSQSKQWATPSCMDTLPARSTEALARAKLKGGCKNLREEVHQWATPKASDPQHAGPNMRDSAGNYALPAQAVREQWATPRAGATDNSRPNNKGGIPLGDQARRAEQWATPQSRDAKGAEGRMIRDGQYSDLPSQIEVAPTGQWNRDNGKLNPRWVETLMGLPIGWTMPSCMSPLTIAPMNCAFWETESSQPPQPELF